MRPSTLLRRNLAHFWRTNLAVVAGVATAVAVLAGALLVGNSVRASLRDLVAQRLGRTDRVLSAPRFVRAELSEDIQKDARFNSEFQAVCPIIALEGAVVHAETGRRASRVQVYGVDGRFFQFHGVDAAVPPLAGRDAFINSTLGQELGAELGDAVLVTVTKPSAIPPDSLHGRKEDRGRTLRLTARAVLSAEMMGDFSTRPSQAGVRTVFVPLSLLQTELDQAGKVNTILISEKTPRNNERGGLLEEVLARAARLEDAGLNVRALPARRALSLESESSLLSNDMARAGEETAASLGMAAHPVLTYLANSMRVGSREIPYSLVSAVDFRNFEALSSLTKTSKTASLPPVVLNDWTARELGAREGDTLALDYYLWKDDVRLVTESAQFQVLGQVPLQGPASDPDLAPDYPGLTDAANLGDWDPPFPIDLSRIRPRDEAYWDMYRTTPKAFIPLEVGKGLWESRFGKLTSLRVVPPEGQDLGAALESYRGNLRKTLDPAGSAFNTFDARAEGLEAANGATDFGEYFTYFSFFLVVSAVLLTVLFFRLGVEQRLREVGTLESLGIPEPFIRDIFLKEGAVLSLLGSIVGMAGGAGYAALIMHGLRTWWVAAVGTSNLSLHVSPTALLLGAAGGIIAASLSIAWTLRGLQSATPRSLLGGVHGSFASAQPASRAAVILGLASLAPVAILVLAATLGVVNLVITFFAAGTLLLVSVFNFQWAWLRKSRKPLLAATGARGLSGLGFRNATQRPGRSILSIALIACATFVIVAVSVFRREDPGAHFGKHSGSGGFPLLAESLLPVHFDPNTAAGRERLNLTGLTGLDRVTFVPFRLKPGDDASCLNLYQPQSPRILGATSEFFRRDRFRFQDALALSPEAKANPWLLLESPSSDGTIPAIADANSMTYVLHLKLGDVLTIAGAGGTQVRLRMVGALADSILQREIIISEENFRRHFPGAEGYRFFLLDLPPEDSRRATQALEETLADYDFDVVPSAELLASFHRVENTYLATFQTLGGLGLLLGTLGLAAVLLRNVLERRRELALLRAVGYRSKDLILIVVAENVLLLVFGLAAGVASAALAVAPAFMARGGEIPAVPWGLLLAVLGAGIAASLAATAAALRSPLIPALKSE